MLDEIRYKSQALQLARQLSVVKMSKGKEHTTLMMGAQHPIHTSTDPLDLVAEENMAAVQVGCEALINLLLEQ